MTDAATQLCHWPLQISARDTLTYCGLSRQKLARELFDPRRLCSGGGISPAEDVHIPGSREYFCTTTNDNKLGCITMQNSINAQATLVKCLIRESPLIPELSSRNTACIKTKSD